MTRHTDTCRACGEIVAPQDVFCGHCGQVVSPNGSAPSNKALLLRTGPGSRSNHVAVGGIAAIGVALIALGGYQASHRDVQQQPQSAARQVQAPPPAQPTLRSTAPAPASMPVRPSFSGFVPPERLMPFASRRDNVFELHQPMRMRVSYPETFAFASPSVSAAKLGSLREGNIVELRSWLSDTSGATWARICLPTRPEEPLRCVWIDYESMVVAP